MPYVEVWVDPEDCDGNCEEGSEGKRIKKRVTEAIGFLHKGDVESALAVLDENYVPLGPSPETMAAKYSDWKNGKLPGFTFYRKENSK